MSRHEGVTCDSCMNANFKGKRYKCLLCYDFDLCTMCYTAGVFTERHLAEHPMQCILTKNDVELYFGGDPNGEHQQSLTCPHCGTLGFSLATLIEHVGSEHSAANMADVICPACAASTANRQTNIRQDLLGHLTLEHRYPSRELSAFFDEPPSRHVASVRRIPPPPPRASAGRGRRPHVHFGSSSTLAAIACSRDSPDPIAEFFSQLSGVGRQQGPSIPPLPAERHRGRNADKTPKRPTPAGNLVPAVSFIDPSTSSLSAALQDSDPSQSFLLPQLLAAPPTDKEIKRVAQIRAERCSTAKLVILTTLVGPETEMI